jgi:hypothetical protein
MRRFAWLLAGIALVAAGLWVAGRPPSRYVLERSCAAFHEERRERLFRIDYDARRPDAEADALRRERDAALQATKRLLIRGWEVLLVPRGGARPAGYRVALRFDPSGTGDPAPLRGDLEVLLAPRAWLARLCARLS